MCWSASTPLAAAGQAGVERMIGLLRDEVIRDMRLMGAAQVADLGRDIHKPRLAEVALPGEPAAAFVVGEVVRLVARPRIGLHAGQ